MRCSRPLTRLSGLRSCLLRLLWLLLTPLVLHPVHTASPAAKAAAGFTADSIDCHLLTPEAHHGGPGALTSLPSSQMAQLASASFCPPQSSQGPAFFPTGAPPRSPWGQGWPRSSQISSPTYVVSDATQRGGHPGINVTDKSIPVAVSRTLLEYEGTGAMANRGTR